MRLALLGLSLLVFGCGGGGDGDSQQPTTSIPDVVQPTIWMPGVESPLSDVNQAKSALITAYHSINISMQLNEKVFSSLNGLNSDNGVPATTTTTTCPGQGTVTITMSQSLLISKSAIRFGQCGESDVIMNGNLSGERNVNGSGEYQTKASFTSPTSDEKIYANSRLIKHEKPTFFINGVTDELSFDMTTAGISASDGINTGGNAIVKTTSPLQFVDALTTSPVGGEITITNSTNRTWLVKVVQNGFDIYDSENSTVVPVDFLSWYSLAK
ncbi:hypothetical protein RI537_18695 [Aeromonas salmonicida]|uniref:hypothetical protein n=1 Tax=Aeromonas salmonicida TaxID=645 RepID=UPI00343215F2